MLLRKLSGVEKFFYARGSLNLPSTFYVTIKLNELPTKNELSQALKKIISSYKILRCNITALEGEVYMNDVIDDDNSLELSDLVEDRDWTKFEEEEQNSVFKQLSFKYNSNKPLWKLLVAEKLNLVVLAMDHIFFDGRSATMVLNTLITNLSALETHEENTDLNIVFSVQDIKDDKVKNTDITNVNLLDDYPVPFSQKIKRFIAGNIFKYSPYSILRPNKELLQFNNYTFASRILKETPSNTGPYEISKESIRKMIHLDKDQLEKVLQHCRNNKVSLTSYLGALVSHYLNEYKVNLDNQGQNIKIEIPVDTRKIIKNKLHLDCDIDLGCYITATDLIKDPTSENNSIEEVAASFQTQLSSAVTANVEDTMFNIKITDVINPYNFFKCKITPEPNQEKIFFGSTFEITNLGKLSSNNDNCRFVIQDAYFGGCVSLTTIFTCYIISTEVGGMNCAITYDKSIERVMNPIVEKCKETLLNIK